MGLSLSPAGAAWYDVVTEGGLLGKRPAPVNGVRHHTVAQPRQLHGKRQRQQHKPANAGQDHP